MARSSLPLVEGREHLDFRCTGCGNCCRDLRVAVTHRDVARLAGATGEPVHALVDWLAPDEVDMSGEPGSFVELSLGRRLMVLAHRAEQCRWLDESFRCRVYAARPIDCRLYPFSIEPCPDGNSIALSLLSFTSCDSPGTADLEPPQSDSISERALALRDEARWSELTEYQGLVARWNRLARHRRRLGRSVGGPAEFFRFLGW